MNKRQFVQQRRTAWARFEYLVDQLDRQSVRKVSASEVGEFSRLLRELSNDLAIIRSRAWGEHWIAYLNHLVARGHNAFYAGTTHDPGQGKVVSPHVGIASSPGAFAQYIAFGFPRVFRRNILYFLAASILLFVPMGASWAVVQNDPTLASRVIDPVTLEQISEAYSFDPDDPDRPLISPNRTQMYGFYISNNVGIALRCFAGGILFGVVTVFFLLTNGISLGAIAGFLISEGHSRSFMSFVVTHGSFELTAIAVAGGAGLMLGNALIHPG
ncbi:MAG: stage II sporulation protein M, partial [Planctomycetaceae bacterium]